MWRSFRNIWICWKICTDITGDQEAYETYGTQVREEVEAVLASVPETGEANRSGFCFIRAGSKYSATKAKTAENNFVCVMLKELGTYNIAENAPVLLDGLSQEEILMGKSGLYFHFHHGQGGGRQGLYGPACFRRKPGSTWTPSKKAGTPIFPRNCFSLSPIKGGARLTGI